MRTEITTNRGDAVRDEKGRFVKGNPGGPGRPPKDMSITSIVKELLDKPAPGHHDKTYLEAIAETWLDACVKGNVELIKELNNRLEGKATQRIDVSAREQFRQLLEELRQPPELLPEVKVLLETDSGDSGELPALPEWLD